MKIKKQIIHAKNALLPNGWAKDIFIEIDEHGKISEIIKDKIIPKKDVSYNEDIILPAMNNLHSHSFQRAMAGLSEKQSPGGNDSFWTWRDLMYKFLDLLTPEDIYSITAFSQMEMLEAGYSCVGEFHYIHNEIGGNHYSNIAELSEKVLEASSDSGINICLLPVLYERGGCDGRDLIGGQLRFKNTFDSYSKLIEKNTELTSKSDNFSLGVAAHSLRAVHDYNIEKIINLIDGPIHIHVAEQVKEVEEIEYAYKLKPVEWLLENQDINEKWCLIHCTQMTENETLALASSGAVAGLCPVTEANLGDGIFNGLEFFKNKGIFGVGTDSNINISLVEELKTFEYSQRLKHKKRSIISQPHKSTGRTVFDHCLKGGSQALQRKNGKIEKGYYADLISLNPKSMDLIGVSKDAILDSWIFSSNYNLIDNLWATGNLLVKNGKHTKRDFIFSNYKQTISKLRSKL